SANDVKLTWELARFPHAYHMARAATLNGQNVDLYARALGEQIGQFIHANPFPYGLHWASGQEIAFRAIAWIFGVATLTTLTSEARHIAPPLPPAALLIGQHIAAEIHYAQHAVYNNHLLSEALGLYALSRMLPPNATTAAWAELGLRELTEQADLQIY